MVEVAEDTTCTSSNHGMGIISFGIDIGNYLQATFASSRTTPILDKDVDLLIDYLTKSYSTGVLLDDGNVTSSNNSGSNNLGDQEEQKKEEDSTCNINDTNNFTKKEEDEEEEEEEGNKAKSKKTQSKSIATTQQQEMKIFQKVTLQSLNLCLDIYTNNAVLSDKQKKKIVFHALLQLGSNMSMMSTLDDMHDVSTFEEEDTVNMTTTMMMVQLLKDALEIILSTALLSSAAATTTTNQVTSTSKKENNSKNTTIGIEMLLTPYLSRLEQTSSNTNSININSNNNNNNNTTTIQQYIIRICTNKLNPMNAAALINSITSLLSSSCTTTAPTSSSTTSSKNNNIITTEMMESFLTNLFHCLYHLSNNEEYDSIPPLIYQICQLIHYNDHDSISISISGSGGGARSSSNHYAVLILCSIISFLEYMLYDSTIIINKKNKNDDDDDDEEEEEENDNHNNKHHNHPAATAAATTTTKKMKNHYQKNQEIQWTIFTSLNHLGSVLRGNPLLPDVLLNILKGKKMNNKKFKVGLRPLSSSSSSSSMKNQYQQESPFRYFKMTPILLAIGLTMATYIPRMRDSTLDVIRDLIYEESLIRIKRRTSHWFNSCAAMLLTSSKALKMNYQGGTFCLSSSGLLDGGSYNSKGGIDDDEIIRKEWESRLKGEFEECQNCEDNDTYDTKHSHMLSCLKSFLSMTGGYRDPTQKKNRENRFHDTSQANSDLYPALVSLGFLLIDSVKKDINIPFSNSVSTGVYLVQELPSCTNAMSQNSNTSIQKEAQAATAKVGRELLKTLFLFVGINCDEDDVVIGNNGYISHATLNPLCRSIVMTMFEKFCCMAPNAIEHSYLLRDIAFAKLDTESNQDTFGNVIELVHLEEYVGASMLEGSFLSNIIDSLSNVPGGGMPPAVAMVSVIPTLRHILRMAIAKESRNQRCCNQLDAHFDHCFLLAKKALFCTDVERRKVAVQLLIMLIDLALERSKNDTDDKYGHTSSSLVDEGIGYIRRCLTQYQSDVRLEVYASLVALVPKFNESDTEPSQPVDLDIAPSISVVSQILLNHLERYVNVREDKSIIQARRKRAIQLGTHLSQQPVESDDEPTIDAAPLHLQMCTKHPSRLATKSRQLKLSQGVKRKKSSGDNSFMDDVTNCILEPIPFLLASSITVSREAKKYAYLHESTKALLQTLQDLRQKVSESNIDQYLNVHDPDSNNRSKSARIVSICILIASIAESLMGIPSIDESPESMDLETIEKLFVLRSDAVMKATTILARHSAKSSNQKKRKTHGSRKKKMDEVDKDNDDDDQGTKPEAKIKSQVLSKSRRIIEETISSICPSNSPLLLSKCLRESGVLSQQKDSEDRLQLYDNDDEEEDLSVEMRLNMNAEFRRFLLEKTDALLEGKSLVLRPADRFDCNQCIEGNDSIGTYYIICSLQLGPICLIEFCSHINRRELTSLVAQDHCPLAQVALRAFVHCIQRMTSYVKGHNMSKIQRLATLMQSSFDAICSQFPSMKPRIEVLRQQEDAVADIQMSEIEGNLTRMILPLIIPINQGKSEIRCCGLLTELLENGLDNEAVLCCNMLTSIIIHMNPNLRQTLGLIILKGFEQVDPGSTKEGLLGLQHDSSLSSSFSCDKSAAQAIDSALYLCGQIDGMTGLISFDPSCTHNIRTLLGFPLSPKSLFENMFGQKIEAEDNMDEDEELYGLPKLLAMSFLDNIGAHHDFGDRHFLDSLDKLSLRCTRLIATQSHGNTSVSKDMISASMTVSNMIDTALVDIEFVASKILSVASGTSLLIVQELLASRLIAVAEAISSYAPSSVSFDNQSSFTVFLLKCTKRIHATLSKLVSSYSTCPQNSMMSQFKSLLKIWSGKFNKRTTSLLLVLQGLQRTKDGKAFADSKIINQGRIAAQVVFEKENIDSTILNLSTKLKAKGINSDFLKEKITISTHRDFRIKVHELQAARERSDNTKNNKKAKSEQKKSTKRAKKNSEEHNSESSCEDELSTVDDEKSIKEDHSVEIQGDDDQSQSSDATEDDSDEE